MEFGLQGGVNGNRYGQIQVADYGYGWERLVLQPYWGNVGIGNTAPAHRFSVLSYDNAEPTNIGAFLAQNQTAGIGIGFYNVRQIYPTQPIYLNAGTSGMVHVGNVSSGGVSH